MTRKYRLEVYDGEGNLIATPEMGTASAFMGGASAGTFEPYITTAARLRIVDGDRVLASYRTMSPEEYREWERQMMRIEGSTGSAQGQTATSPEPGKPE